MKIRTASNRCVDTALRILARRDHSCAELSRKLTDRGFAEAQIKFALGECSRLNYLDDDRFAAGYARQLQRKGYGCRRIEQMLIAKGLRRQIIADCLEACCPEDVQIEACRQALIKKLTRSQSLDDSIAAKSKLYRFLLARGFSAHVIRLVLEEGMPQGKVPRENMV